MRSFSLAITRLLVASVLVVGAACVHAGNGKTGGGEHGPSALDPWPPQIRRHPVVVFPAFHFTKLQVHVHGQTVAPECPAHGFFQDWYPNGGSLAVFNQVCRDKLMTLVYDPDPTKPMSQRFSDQPGVQVTVMDYGRTESAPFYEHLYGFLEANGYERNKSIAVAGYDSRLTPDMHFLARTKRLIEDVSAANGNTPVHLVGHSNGPLYAQYLLTHTSKEWKNRFIHGFTAIAGNWPGQGLFYPVYFTGLNVRDFKFPETVENADSSARMYQSHPSTYMSSAAPVVFRDFVVVLRDASTGVAYTPKDHQQIFQDAGLSLARELAAHYIGFVKFTPPFFPNVDVNIEIGSGLETVVGAELPDLTTGQPLGAAPGFVRDGDANQEDITNESIRVWQSMPCYRFTFNNNKGVDHFALPRDRAVLNRLLSNLQRLKSVCL